MEASLKLGNGNWAVKEDSLLAYDDVGGKFRPLPFDFTRASSATVVNKQGLIETVGSGIPRIDFSDDVNGALLLEPQSTNLITQSEDFSNASWIKTRSSISSNSAISPDGTLNADKLIEGTSTNTHSTQSNVTIGNVDTTISVFVKADTRSRVRFILTDLATGDYRIDLNLNNLSVIENNAGNLGSWTNTSYKIENFTNNWYKVSLTATKGAGSQAALSINLLDNSGNNVYTGDGTSGIYIYGAQLEQQSYATSYIPTQGAISTRLKDIANNSGNASLINSEEGVLYFEGSALADDGTNRFISLSDGTINNRINIVFDTSNNINARQAPGSVNISTSGVNILNSNKIAYKYQNGNQELWVNGIKIGTTSVSTLPIGLDRLNFDSFNGGDFMYGKTKALAVYKTALTDANLRSLTYPPAVATTFDLNFNTIADDFTFTRGSDATFVNAQGLIQSTASNDAPRLDYSTGSEAFLLEPQSTNLVTYSELFSNAAWNKNSVTLESGYLAPDGTNTAFKVDGNNSFILSTVVTGLVATSTRSIYARTVSGTGTSQLLTHNSNTDNIFTITEQWQRFEVSTANSSFPDYFYAVDFRGSGTLSEIILWGANATNDQNYATSYIPTSGASATRNQELCNNATPVINSEEGTLYAEISASSNNLPSNHSISITDGTNVNRLYIYRSVSEQKYGFALFSNNSLQCHIKSGVINYTEKSKIAVKYKENDFALWINGVEVGVDTSGNTFTSGVLNKLAFNNGSSNPFFGNTKDLKYYPKALADVQLQDLTSWGSFTEMANALNYTIK